MIKEQFERIKNLKDSLDISAKEAQILELEKIVSEPSFWDDQDNAKRIMSQVNSLRRVCDEWMSLDKKASDSVELLKMAESENDEDMIKEINLAAEKLEHELSAFETKTKLSGEFDANNAILSIHSGAGGTEACDWAQMLVRLYSRWAERHGFQVEVVDSLDGEEAGIKSITMIVKGEFAYGLLQSEIGVHRLVRVSPFDSNSRRHTSFASVDVIPEVPDDIDIVIDDKDIRIDTYRASGAGGQHINKTDSAVRITHLATGIIVQSQNDRSQIKNRATAMKLLMARLYELEREKKRSSYEKHYNEKGAIEWGSQIRSYVFMPYQLVKDHRTNYETSQVNLVMDGEIDEFIKHYLTWKLANKK
jgi:peptide chain release factor 2